MIDRTGETFGKMTVTADLGGEGLQCQCQCGRSGTYPRSITKPSYRGPKACPWCLGTPCEECNTTIPNKGRMPAKTCSESCRVARANRREKERYQRIKDSDHFKETRANYIARIQGNMEADPELAASIRKDRNRATREWRDRQLQNPDTRARFVVSNRKKQRLWLERTHSKSELHAELLKKKRDWYHSLSAADYQRIFVEARNKKPRN